MIIARIKVHGVIGKYVTTGKDVFQIELPDGHTINDLIDHLGIPHEEVWLALMDDIRTSFETPIRDGSLIQLFSPVVGG